MPNSLSQWDLEFLTPGEQKQVIDYKNQWMNAPDQRGSLHNIAEEIRARYGYSGGSDGSQYIPIDTFQPPTAPTIPEYQSQYADTINDIFKQMQTQQQYNSPYENLINQQISQIVNRQFSYDPENDAAYQAFKERALRAGDKAYADNLGGLSAMTGGRANSWAGTVASQARNQYVLQAEEAALHFEERAYSRYRDETADMYNLVNLLNSQDEIAYSRFRDAIGDTKDLAGLVLQLDEREFDRYKYMSDQQWRTYEYEYNAYKDSLDHRRSQIAEALDRTNLQGYVSNKDSIILGVPTGTLSQSARERAEAMEDYISKSKIDLENDFKKMQESHKYDLEIIKAKEASDLRMMNASAKLSRSGSGGSGTGSGSYNLAKSDGDNRDKLVNSFNSYVESKDFQRLSPDAKYSYIAKYVDKIVKDHADGLYGKNGDWIASQVLAEIENTEAFRRYYQQYEAIQNSGYVEHPLDQFSLRYGTKSIYDNTGSHRNFLQSI